MKIKVVTTYKPGTWEKYSGRGIESIAKNWPKEIDMFVLHEEPKPNCKFDRITWIDMDSAVPSITNFKNKHKNDPVACGETTPIEGGVRRLPNAGNMDRGKGSYLWDAVRFANKVICVVNGVKNSKDYDYMIWIDADTFTFRPIPLKFLEDLLPIDTMITYLGRENPALINATKYPECGFVGYNLKHPEVQNFVNEWEQLYITDNIFKLLEWHDSFVFWHLIKKFKKEKSIKVNDIGHMKGVKGHHVFINSELGLYIDHMKGKRKQAGTSGKDDLRKAPTLEYWKQVPTFWKQK